MVTFIQKYVINKEEQIRERKGIANGKKEAQNNRKEDSNRFIMVDLLFYGKI